MNATLKAAASFVGQLIAGLLVLVAVFFLFTYLSYDKDWEEDATWVEVTGTLIHPSTKVSIFSYDYKGTSYTEQGYHAFSIVGNTKNEKYILKINPKKPDHYVVVGWKPLFTNDEATKTCIGRVTSLIKKETPVVLFEYAVDGQTYSRGQYLPAALVQYPQLKKGAQYEVQYWVNDPQRAIIRVDKSVR